MEAPKDFLINPTSIEIYISFVFISILVFKIIRFFTSKLSKKYIDLHCHLDGSITIEIAKKLAAIQHMDKKSDKELENLLYAPEECTSLNQFLDCFSYPVSLMQSKEGLSESVKLVADNIKSQGVIYAELRFAPQLHTQGKMNQEDAVKAALEGLKRTDLKVNLILCFMRGKGNEKENWETLRLAKKYLVKDGGVVAVDLAGAEALFPTKDYKDLFYECQKYHIPYTIHAGEADGPESVRKAIEFGTKRIGHGTRAIKDPSVVQLIKENGIFLEMCPTSNMQTKAVENMDEYPFMYYLNEGINVTLNTDDMAIERTTLAKEFEYMEKKFGLNKEQEKRILLNSINAAFTTDEVKQELRKKIKFNIIECLY